MPEKPKAPAPKGVAWDPDIYSTVEFAKGLNDLRTKPEITMVKPAVMEQLARLARAHVDDSEFFRAGITFSVQTAHKDFPLLSTPVYCGELLERIEKVEQAAKGLQEELQALANPVDRTALWAREAIGLRVASHLSELSALIEAIGEAKISGAPYTTFAQKKGAPAGAGGSGMALTRFVAHLGWAALAAEGDWTLNKNDQSGTLIEAIELLREFLPIKFLSPKGQHPYSTYQKILTDARSKWNSHSTSFHGRRWTRNES